MINYRNIFNPSYNYIGLIIIIAIILIIFLIQKDTITSLIKISKSTFIAGIITLAIALMLNLFIDVLITSSYKVFIQIISENVINNLYLYSVVTIIISITVRLVTETIVQRKKV